MIFISEEALNLRQHPKKHNIMKLSAINCLLSLSMSIVFSSCSQQHAHVDPLSQADSLMQMHPDSALNILKGISHPEAMDATDQAMYALLLTQARDKNAIQHTNDSLISIAVAHYQAEPGGDRKAQTYYYLGRVYQDTNEWLGAIEAYLKALEADPQDSKLQLLIYDNLAACYKNQQLYSKAKEMFQQSYQISTQQKQDKEALFSIRGIASIYALQDSMPMALNYYLKALSILKNTNDSTWKSAILCDIARTYESMNMPEEAEDYINHSIQNTPAGDNLSATYFWKGKILYRLCQYDSATHHLEAATQGSGLYTQASIYQTLYQLKAEAGEYKQATRYNDTALLLYDSIQSMVHHAEIAGITREHAIELHKQEASSKHKQKVAQIIIIALFILLCILSLAIYFICRSKKTNFMLHLQLKRNQADQTSLKKRIQQLENIYEETEKTRQEMQNSLLQSWEQLFNVCARLFRTTEVYKRIRVVEAMKMICDRNLTQEEIGLVHKEIIENFDEPFCQLSEMYPKLRPNDLTYCALNYLNISTDIILICMGTESTLALTQRKYRIKKQLDTRISNYIFESATV